ncbi:hypothetical protein SERLA73DRAFT_187781 [Serpula lacrymans var. lacrymans S7.3]|uniref:Origin recognition complex subunit 2 winged-helix domain-containing protein n=2 Tax=Serpula lacrymans var. lacrymans TaxID=341189 RepID=F8QAD1_SERL3|nr:uncharacterized protein SERLADRAFT_477582 [Serpula lacrymans var. lacrymans S7.9]EGN94721.1 hypothetical protein SERLA73DRAFT_187781 [Serpula lacrymans var. lacrymans S7.3]EGO20200.1 hypothetical protein SERLADRAFT_477582 [Serpula lacrymans var. lacrymans S7.9]
MPTSNMPTTPSHAATSSGAPPTYALPYDQLFHLARDHFLATSDGALRALLGEFKDHGLVVSSATGEQSTEVMWIPMRRERLIRVLETLGDT